MFLPTVAAFYIALTNGLAKALFFLLGVYLTTVFYPYFFGNSEQKHWVGIGAALAFAYLFYTFVGAFMGWLVRLIYLKFFNKRATQAAQKITEYTDTFTEHIPKAAYETYTYTQKASRTGYIALFAALFFAAIGAVLYLYPVPPLNPIASPLLQRAIGWLGIAFLLIALYMFWRSLRLIRDNSAWHIVIDDKTLLYETPKSTREKRFSCKLDEIERIEETIIQSSDDAEVSAIYTIVLKNGQSYRLFSDGLNRINEQRFLDALRARGVRVVQGS